MCALGVTLACWNGQFDARGRGSSVGARKSTPGGQSAGRAHGLSTQTRREASERGRGRSRGPARTPRTCTNRAPAPPGICKGTDVPGRLTDRPAARGDRVRAAGPPPVRRRPHRRRRSPPPGPSPPPVPTAGSVPTAGPARFRPRRRLPWRDGGPCSCRTPPRAGPCGRLCGCAYDAGRRAGGRRRGHRAATIRRPARTGDPSARPARIRSRVRPRAAARTRHRSCACSGPRAPRTPRCRRRARAAQRRRRPRPARLRRDRRRAGADQGARRSAATGSPCTATMTSTASARRRSWSARCAGSAPT